MKLLEGSLEEHLEARFITDLEALLEEVGVCSLERSLEAYLEAYLEACLEEL